MHPQVSQIAQNHQSNHEILQKILDEGQYFIFNDYTNKDKFFDLVRTSLFQGIESIEGRDCRQAIETEGLHKMHEHFSADNIMHLEKFVKDKIGTPLLQVTSEIAKNDLGLKKKFFVEDIIEVRLHYPFENARQSKVTFKDYDSYMYGEPVNPPSREQKVKVKVKSFIKKFINYVDSKVLKQSNKDISGGIEYYEYHGVLPYAAAAHGPHIDSWLGNPLNGINLWWAIAGVKENNTVILYPETFGKPLEHIENGAYIAPGITLPKPIPITLSDNSLLIFNSDLLHGTHLNISEFTRVAITTRIAIPKEEKSSQLRFNINASKGLLAKDWHDSEDIAKGELETITEFWRGKENSGVPHEHIQKLHLEKRISITVNSAFLEEVPITLCPDHTLGIGEKMLVKFKKESVIVFRTIEGFQAVNAICPHLGINLIDGFHDEQHIYCPGHGVAFCLADGSSQCNLLKLRVYRAYAQDGQIVLEKLRS